MTREEILKLEPGPELDRLVAEQVMRWRLDEDWQEWFDAQGHSQGWQEDFKPSADIAAAMEVVNKLLPRYNISIYSGRYPIRWFVQIVAVEDWETKALVEDENLPLAICRAALLAMEASNG